MRGAVSIYLFYFAAVLLPWCSVTINQAHASSYTAVGKQKGSAVVRLTRDNFETATKGQSLVFVKFFAPWCSHSKKMEGDWEKLAEDYNGDSNNPESGGLLVAEVDCTDDSVAGGGKALCNWFGIESFPTLRYGERTHDGRNELQHREFDDYNGKRSYHELSVFSKEILLPMLCSPGNPDGCADDAVRDAVNEYNRLSVSELKASIKHLKEKLERAEAIYRGEVERLTADYNDAEEAKRTAIDRVASSGGDLEIARQTLFMFKKQQQQKTSRQQVKSDEL